jgi:hypothetical protein
VRWKFNIIESRIIIAPDAVHAGGVTRKAAEETGMPRAAAGTTLLTRK